MEKDQFLQHDVTACSNVRIMMLIDAYGMEGVYWVLMEYLCMQVRYSSLLSLLKKRVCQVHVLFSKFVHLVDDLGSFCIANNRFSSRVWDGIMEQLDDKRECFMEWRHKKMEDKLLKISDGVVSPPLAIIGKLSIGKLSIDKSSVVEDLSDAGFGLSTTTKSLYHDFFCFSNVEIITRRFIRCRGGKFSARTIGHDLGSKCITKAIKNIVLRDRGVCQKSTSCSNMSL